MPVLYCTQPGLYRGAVGVFMYPFSLLAKTKFRFYIPLCYLSYCVSWLNAPKLEKTDLYFSGQKYITMIGEVVSSIALSHLIKLIPCQVDLSCPVP